MQAYLASGVVDTLRLKVADEWKTAAARDFCYMLLKYTATLSARFG